MATIVEYRQIRAGAETACAELIAGIEAKVTGEERVAVACALARAATQFQEATLVEHWLAEDMIGAHGGFVLSYGYFHRLAKLTGLSEKALERRFRRAVHDASRPASQDQS